LSPAGVIAWWHQGSHNWSSLLCTQYSVLSTWYFV